MTGEDHITDEPVVETKGPLVVIVIIAVLSIGTILFIATVYVVYTGKVMLRLITFYNTVTNLVVPC